MSEVKRVVKQKVKQIVKQSYGRTPAFQAGRRDSNSLGGTSIFRLLQHGYSEGFNCYN